MSFAYVFPMMMSLVLVIISSRCDFVIYCIRQLKVNRTLGPRSKLSFQVSLAGFIEIVWRAKKKLEKLRKLTWDRVKKHSVLFFWTNM